MTFRARKSIFAATVIVFLGLVFVFHDRLSATLSHHQKANDINHHIGSILPSLSVTEQDAFHQREQKGTHQEATTPSPAAGIGAEGQANDQHTKQHRDPKTYTDIYNTIQDNNFDTNNDQPENHSPATASSSPISCSSSHICSSLDEFSDGQWVLQIPSLSSSFNDDNGQRSLESDTGSRTQDDNCPSIFAKYRHPCLLQTTPSPQQETQESVDLLNSNEQGEEKKSDSFASEQLRLKKVDQWQWKTRSGCELEPWDRNEFLKTLEKRSMVVVGDSMSLEMFIGLSCKLGKQVLEDGSSDEGLVLHEPEVVDIQQKDEEESETAETSSSSVIDQESQKSKLQTLMQISEGKVTETEAWKLELKSEKSDHFMLTYIQSDYLIKQNEHALKMNLAQEQPIHGLTELNLDAFFKVFKSNAEFEEDAQERHEQGVKNAPWIETLDLPQTGYLILSTDNPWKVSDLTEYKQMVDNVLSFLHQRHPSLRVLVRASIQSNRAGERHQSLLQVSSAQEGPEPNEFNWQLLRDMNQIWKDSINVWSMGTNRHNIKFLDPSAVTESRPNAHSKPIHGTRMNDCFCSCMPVIDLWNTMVWHEIQVWEKADAAWNNQQA